jgi:hypothetical protein
MTVENKKIKHYCNNCQHETNHLVVNTRKRFHEDPEYRMCSFYMMVECNGCESISFRREEHDYEVTYLDEHDEWVHDISVDIYPSPLKNHKPISHFLLPPQIRIVYNETIEALKSNCFLLAGIGFRAIIEAICIEEGIKGKDLNKKIGNLSTHRLITDKEADRLHAVRFLGNDSVHEMTVPKETTLYVVLEIIDHLLNTLYIIDLHAKPVLDTFIKVYEDFESLLMKKLSKFNSGDDFPLAKFLEKDIRRLNGAFGKFETELINNIESGDFTKLRKGDKKLFGENSKDLYQHFIKV